MTRTQLSKFAKSELIGALIFSIRRAAITGGLQRNHLLQMIDNLHAGITQPFKKWTKQDLVYFIAGTKARHMIYIEEFLVNLTK